MIHVRSDGVLASEDNRRYVKIYADTAAEIPDPADHPEWEVGSELRVLEDGGKKYTLSNAGTWVETPNFSGGGKGGESDDRYVTPQMFGAVGDGKTDDTKAFKECFLHTNIFIPAGKYVISDAIDVLPRTKVMGEGAFKSSIYLKSDLLFNVQEYAAFSDMAIYGNNENTGIVFPFRNLRLHNVRFRYLKYGVRSDAEGVLYNTFVDCGFLSVKYPLYFPNAQIFNTTIVSNCEFNTYDVAVSVLGTIYSINFDRCIFEGGEAGNCVLDAGECTSILFSSCYYENHGELVSSRLVRGNITVRDTWIHEADHVVLAKESRCRLFVKFVDSTIVNSNSEEDSHGFIIDGTNLSVDLTNCMTKGVSDTTIFPITTADMAAGYGVATNCTINGGYLTLDTLPIYDGEVE